MPVSIRKCSNSRCHAFLQARIKAKAIAINTFLPKNGFRPLDMSLYAQQRYTASFYFPPVYSPQQPFPLYSLIAPQTWSATHSYLDPPLVSPVYTWALWREPRGRRRRLGRRGLHAVRLLHGFALWFCGRGTRAVPWKQLLNNLVPGFCPVRLSPAWHFLS